MKITIKHYVLRKVVRLLNFLLRHCEIPPAESWQSITLPINKDSIVKVLDMLDYGLLRYARNDGGSGYFVIARDSLESRGNLSINAVTNGCNGIFKSQDKIMDL